MNKPKIIFTGGGSAGHIFPLVGISEYLQQAQIYYFGSGLELEKQTAKNNNFEYKQIQSGKFRRNLDLENIFLNIIDFFKFLIGFVQALIELKKIDPVLVFSKGGFVALPVCYAAKFLRIPVLIHESDIKMGLANIICSKFANAIYLGFPLGEYEIDRSRSFYTGIPLRKEFFTAADSSGTGDHLLVIGGSLGAVSLNNLIIDKAGELTRDFHITHLTGGYDFDRVKDLHDKLSEDVKRRYKVVAFDENMKELMDKASVVIARAGATSIFECSSLGKALVLVPIPASVTPHQTDNAQYLQRNKMAVVFHHSQSGDLFVKAVQDARAKKDELSQNIKNLSFSNSSKIIARRINEFIESDGIRKIKKIHFIGYKGVSMSQLYSISKQLGFEVTGSDIKEAGHSPKYVNKDIDLVVYSSAVSNHSPAFGELDEAKKLGLKCIKRSEFVGMLMLGKKSVCISGMHGKTTITSSIAKSLSQFNEKTSFLIGSPDTDSNPSFRYHVEGPIVVEACEYDRSFLDMPCDIAVISNIEKEHLDYYKGGIEEIINAFADFVRRVKPGGMIFINGDDSNIQKVLHLAKEYIAVNRITIQSVGFEKGDFQIKDFKDGLKGFSVAKGVKKQMFEMAMRGKYNAFNLSLAYSVLAEGLGVEPKLASESLSKISAPARRFQKIFEIGKVSAYDDYAHHPSELRELIKMIDSNFASKKKVIVYQQHQQQRFDELYSDYLKVFTENMIDEFVILPVHKIAGRETSEQHNADGLVATLKSIGKHVTFAKDYDDASKVVASLVHGETLVVTVGATDVYKTLDRLKNNLN